MVLFCHLGIRAKVCEHTEIAGFRPTAALPLCTQILHGLDSNALKVCQIPSTDSLTPLLPPSPGDHDDKMKESLAAPRHSRDQAQHTYDRRTANEKAAALELARRRKGPASQSQAHWRSPWDNSWGWWQRKAPCKSRLSSSGVSKLSCRAIRRAQRVKSESCGTRTIKGERKLYIKLQI